MRTKLDLTGQRFGKLVCLNSTDKRDPHGNVMWQCQCECGELRLAASVSLKRGGIKSCGCLGYRLSKGKAVFNSIFRAYKNNAKKRGLSFELTEKEFKKLTKQNCHYCGGIPTRILNRKNYNGTYTYNGVDRIDNNKGYFLNNCVPCCSICNSMKEDSPVDTFIKHTKQIVEHLSR